MDHNHATFAYLRCNTINTCPSLSLHPQFKSTIAFQNSCINCVIIMHINFFTGCQLHDIYVVFRNIQCKYFIYIFYLFLV